jgi:hypothetical protein
MLGPMMPAAEFHARQASAIHYACSKHRNASVVLLVQNRCNSGSAELEQSKGHGGSAAWQLHGRLRVCGASSLLGSANTNVYLFAIMNKHV